VNQDAVEYMVFPRLLALAERAWHYARATTPSMPTFLSSSRRPTLGYRGTTPKKKDWATNFSGTSVMWTPSPMWSVVSRIAMFPMSATPSTRFPISTPSTPN
ncbi:MAG TPA: hypothetical protein EYO88_01565, partial [Alphaproteobacteria bacterium]|nr:hypothetical protein [Alphaproteobacteria bacterium]